MLTSRHHPICKLVRSLHAGKGRRQHRLFVIEGSNAVAGALAARWPLQRLLVPPDELGQEWERLAATSDIATQVVDADILEYLSEAQTAPDVIAIGEWPEAVSYRDEGLLLIVDGISDPGNAGTLVRAADAAGASAVATTRNSADLFAPKAVRAAAGSLFHFPLLDINAAEPETIVAELAAQNVPIITAEAHNGTDCFQFDWPRRCALVLGHETRGISPQLSIAARARVTIPIYGRAESLNVAMAGTVLLYAWRQAQAR